MLLHLQQRTLIIFGEVVLVIFCNLFGIFVICGFIAAIVGLILILVGAGIGPSFSVITAGIVLIAAGIGFGVFGIVGCCCRFP